MWFGTNGDILMRRSYDISYFSAVVRFPNEISHLLALVRFAWFCVCKLVGSLEGDERKLGGGGGVCCKCECVGRQKGLCGSSLIRVTSMHSIKLVRMFEDRDLNMLL
jgi:hypothetical protein